MRRWMTVRSDWRRPEVADSHTLWWSDAAAYGALFPRPSGQEVAAFYDFAEYYTHRSDGAMSRRRATSLALRILMAIAYRLDHGHEPVLDWWERLLPDARRHCLEIGCGAGGDMELLSPYFETITGVDPDRRACRVARDRGLTVHEAIAEDLPQAVRDMHYDLIVMLHVLEHCLDPLAALQQAGSVLSDDGILMVEVPNNQALGRSLKQDNWHWLDVPRHLNFFTEQSLTTICARAGLKVQRIEYRGYCRQFDERWIATEAAIAARHEGRAEATAAEFTRHALQQALLLAMTGLAPKARKYDSVRAICTRA
ncbi:class I SAM-dependent methyltransferase [Roseicitreum antarcticum]|nr:class I SAM-dependent methyltransferase [Roseicitreum antarcticum]